MKRKEGWNEKKGLVVERGLAAKVVSPFVLSGEWFGLLVIFCEQQNRPESFETDFVNYEG